ncbi:ABC transporter ATP-binding protein [Agrobacterium cavarae]|uniref:ABC transporter ATP-binding protein n=1 Tax=Agrobacterium cavarae TaxID=2528239 RepID=A0ABY1Y8V6_9HYPH|nr:ATP-binding cassette domain-containing protein [Agrobacterium cavarae]TBN12424.1 ABC transporter ATP-binding protein [Agrobacterium cavarae]
MEPFFSVNHLSKRYQSQGRTVQALDDVSFTLARGETLGLAGPSGCGKSTLARIIMRLSPADGGEVRFQGRNWLALSGQDLRAARRHVQMVFQDTYGAFNPRATVADAIGEPLRIHRIVAPRDRQAEIARLLERVGLGADYAARPVLQLSGGQRQRVAIARAIACRPSLLVMDEAVSALDVSVRAQILELLVSLQSETGLSCLFVSHDLAVIRAVCHRVAIMEMGRVVEQGETDSVISNPQSDTAKRLIAAVPTLRKDQSHA